MEGWKPPFLPAPEGGGFRAATVKPKNASPHRYGEGFALNQPSMLLDDAPLVVIRR